MPRRLLLLIAALALAMTALPGAAGAQEDPPPAPDDEIPEAALPLAVVPVTGVVPDLVEIDAPETTGTETYEVQAVEVTDLQVDVQGLAPAAVDTDPIAQDPTNGDPFDSGEGTQDYFVGTTSDDARLVAEILDTTSQDIDLFVGAGPTPSAATLLCVSAAGGSDEVCDLRHLPAGDYWIRVQNWEATDPPPGDVTTTSYGITAGDAGNLEVDAPNTSPPGEPFDVELTYTLPGSVPDDRFYGAVTLGTDAENPDNIGTTGVNLTRTDPGADPDIVVTTAPDEAPSERELKIERSRDLAQEADEAGDYFVRLASPAAPSYEGGIDGLAATAVTGGAKFDASAPAVQAYRDHLRAEQDRALEAIGSELGRQPDVRFRYDLAYNGFAIGATPQEAARIALLDGVTDVRRSVDRELHTDAGPEFIGAPAIWGEDGDDTGTKGEGILAGIIDTGVIPTNPSFAEVGPIDGYEHQWEGSYLGVCDPTSLDPLNPHDPTFACNDKLVGAYDFTGRPSGARDNDGHGTHTGSTTAGNEVEALIESPADPDVSNTPVIKGVAPHANVVSYAVCTDGCSLFAILEAIDQAIADGVDVINYSIGSSSASDLWNDPDTLGYLNARRAGIFVATSAGNSGPGEATVGSPADAPWITSVGASEHNRSYANTVTDLTRDDGVTFPDTEGKGFTGGLASGTPIVYAGVFGNELCEPGVFAPGTFDGEIVVCDRGLFGRVAKSQAVADAGGGGFVLVNDVAAQASLNADAFAVPGVHVTFEEGTALKDWLAEGTGHTAGISGFSVDTDSPFTDMQASFSSRGPNRAVDVISPNVTAPGVDIIAALGAVTTPVDPEPVEWGFLSGTSMSSPHVAGSGALMTAVHPDWSPAEIQSALMTTGVTDTRKEDNVTPGDPYSHGSGRINLADAVNAGLVLDETYEGYLAANPEAGGEPREINIASMANTECLVECSWTRTVKGTVDTTWTVEVDAPEGVDVSVSPDSFALTEGGTQELQITADVLNAEAEVTHFAEITLVPEQPVEPPVEPGPADVIRLSGPGRIETAIAISNDSYGDGEAATVVLARADDYPDALAGAALAIAADGPLLITSSNELVGIVADELQRVLPSGGTVHVLGGDAAIEPATYGAVADLGYDVERIFGPTRFETAVAIAEFLGSPDASLVTTGLDFPDALAAGAATGQVDGAVLLTAGEDRHAAVDAYLDGKDDAQLWAVGGPSARAYPEATPVFGTTRDGTAVAAAEEFFAEQPAFVGFARRNDFPDSLTGGAHIGRLGGPLLLTYTDQLSVEPEDYLCERAGGFETGYVYGGTAAINDQVLDLLRERINGEGCNVPQE